MKSRLDPSVGSFDDLQEAHAGEGPATVQGYGRPFSTERAARSSSDFRLSKRYPEANRLVTHRVQSIRSVTWASTAVLTDPRKHFSSLM